MLRQMHGMVRNFRNPHSSDVEEQFPKQAFAAKQSCFVASCHVAALLWHQDELP